VHYAGDGRNPERVKGRARGTADGQHRGQAAAGQEDGQPASVRRARRAADWGKNKYAGSWAEYLWHQLDAVDFMNQAMLLAAALLLCAVPFLLIASALAGRSMVSGLTVRLGLNQQAAADMSHLFTSSSATSNAVTGLSWAFFILAGIAARSRPRAPRQIGP
jgi:membrane protein